MQNLRDVFSAPFNWCDRRCERCPLAAECPVYRHDLQRRWVHEARGRDPDGPEAVAEDMRESIELTLRMVEEIATAEGIDLTAPIPPRPIVLDARRLQRAALTIAKCVVEQARVADPQAEPDIAELRRLSHTLAMKAARIAGYLEDDLSEESWASDAAPNLLLLDRVKAEMAAGFARLAGERDEHAARALQEIDRVLDPLIREVGEPARAVLEALEARDAAPSPFLRKRDGSALASA